ncbi:chemotaxis protein CheA [Brevundimonas sp. LM2]|uniref:chemotaxis protein CheA n=1 Tax=Brevundimonas sp. LM2 TaxID=1938605 RepID=UPI000983DCAA|nr:chemotaxis protein CheA [Brevundimonas sp. LM2]AQR63109.1 chemotaxis protein CheA [Brevundimonas sp. LM2]
MDPMEAIKATFFQECEELLADLESGLLILEEGRGDGETVNAVFRAVHSVKGGAGAFGLDALVRFAHVFETTLDGLRNGELEADPVLLAVLLRSADRLSDHITAAKSGEALDDDGDQDLVNQLEAFCASAEHGDGELEVPIAFAVVPLSLGDPEPDGTSITRPAQTSSDQWRIDFRPHANLYRSANDASVLFRELGRLGALRIELNADALPTLDALNVDEAYLSWTLWLTSDVGRATIRDVFEFVDGDCDLVVAAADPDGDASTEGTGAAAFPMVTLEAQSSSDVAGGQATMTLAELLAMAKGEDPAAEARTLATVSPAPATDPVGSVGFAQPPKAKPAPKSNEPAQASIRVDLDRVDRLIDLVGELVINQAMLAQQVHEAGVGRSKNISLGLDDLEQLTREIQDSVMAIRAQPVKSVFQRMPRLIREVAAMTGKSVRLVTEGEGTEVDKTVIERLSDPLTHMIRNAVDHGLESPEAREAAGKPAEGVIRLAALHRSGRIVIEVSDDGKGIDRPRVRSIAVERGLIEADAVLTDEEVDNLIFAPGFSTASEVSDISGRGVGMDVVKRSIQALGGRISITSVPGKGSTFTLSLPLTLAVLDGMVVSVGDQTLVVPITVIVETLKPKAADIRSLGPNSTVLAVRGSHVPLIDVATALGFGTGAGAGTGVTILVESELGGLAALRVDSIQGQRQVVIKSLEQNYDQVPGIAAATILGDGRVALIVDVDGVIALRRQMPPRALVLDKAS